MAQIGDLEEFRLVRPLGRGGMGEVYLGHDTVLDRAVAIKVIGAGAPDAVSRERFLIEARAIARLSHPNVVTIYRVGTTAGGRPFLVQELIRGVSLDHVPRPVPWREVCTLAIGLARGLEAAHRRGIIHRDVKPANVMLDEHGTARLLDFGLATLSADHRPGADAGPRARAIDALADTDAPRTLAAAAASPPPTIRALATPNALAATGDPGDGARADERWALSGDALAATRDPAGAALAETCDPAGAASTVGAGSHEGRAWSSVASHGAVARGTGGGLPVGGTAAGSARASSREPTLPGAVQGTPRYTAPELWLGRPATARSDLYSLGVMLYELLAGALPYAQPELGELRAAVLAGTPPPITAPDVEPALARLVMRCLAVDPAARPASAAAIAHELEGLLAGVAELPAGNPYRGLRAFDAAHRGLFFGRGQDVELLVDRLRGEPLVVVVGDSGIGKSSVCHAGVVPAVLAGALGGRRTWRAVAIAPGRAPWAALCEALAPAMRDVASDRGGLVVAGALGDAAALDDASIDAIVRRLSLAGETALLVVIDQLEELVTLSRPDEAAQVARLLAAIGAGVPGVKALVAVRGDFLTRVAALPELGAAMTRGLHLLRVLTPGDLREVVVGPARALGVRYETDAMVDALVAAVADDPGALPLLQFTLAELWPARDGDTIPAGALAALGGVEGGLAGHADAVLLAMPAGARAVARRIVLRLVTPEGTRTVCDPEELVDGPVAAAALESLVRGRIVVARDTPAGTPSYALAHDALIGSWGTLRDWLDAAAGQHAARNRLHAAAAEWRRLDRRADLLWARRQLDEIAGLDDLTDDERAFVATSRRHARRQRFTRIAALAAAPLIALAIFAGVRFEAARTRAATVALRSWAAAGHKATADVLAARDRVTRTAAFAAFDAGDDVAGELRWAEARRLAAAAHAAYQDAAAELEAAFLIDAGVVRAQMAAVVWSQAELADREHDAARLAELLRRLATYDAARAAAWSRPARLVIELDRPGRVAVHRFPVPAGHASLAGGFDAQPVVVRQTARLDEALPPGSYLAVITAPDGATVRDPVLLASGQRVTRPIAVPTSRSDGMLYIPGGWFLYGAARDDDVRREFLKAQPLHPVEGRAFWIARTEVTFGDWMAYLRALPAAERAARRQARGDVQLDEQDGRFTLTLEPSPHSVHRAAEGERLVYPGRKLRREVRWERLPVNGVSLLDARAYTAWLDRTGRIPGARICTLREWEHAARGADGRSFPHGETLRARDANFDETYGQVSDSFGPDEVGSFPASDSPYGVADLVGNLWEWTVDDRDGAWYRGGSFYQDRMSAISINAIHAEPSQRNVRIGIRVCADAARSR